MKYANVNPKLLIVYYSRSGRTREVARAIANASAAELEEIREETSRAGLLGYVRSGFEGFLGSEPATFPAQKDPRAYDVVIIGSPTWGASVSSPVRAYMAAQRRALPEVAFFCTMSGERGGDRLLAQMSDLAGKSPLAKLALPDSLVRKPAVCIGEFLETLLNVWEQRRSQTQQHCCLTGRS